MQTIGQRLLFLVLLLITAGAGCTRTPGAGVVSVSGSTTLFAVTQAAAEEFNRTQEGAKATVQGGGSSAGIEGVIAGSTDVGMSSRDLKGDELKAGLADTVVAIDAIAIIVNPTNPITGLTHSQVRGIFSGKITNWKQVGGRDLPIVLINRDEASGTREAFKKKVMNDVPFAKDAVVQQGSGQVRSIVGSTAAAVGYISLGYVTKEVKTLAFDGVKPSAGTVKSGDYGLSRRLHFFTKGRPAGNAKRFIDFFLSPAVQREIVSIEFVPVRG